MNARRRGLFRPRNVALTDKRDPMTRLLQDCNNKGSGMVEVEYAQQWPTLIKAMRLGYVDDNQRMTDKGREFLAKKVAA